MFVFGWAHRCLNGFFLALTVCELRALLVVSKCVDFDCFPMMIQWISKGSPRKLSRIWVLTTAARIKGNHSDRLIDLSLSPVATPAVHSKVRWFCGC